MAQIIKHRRGSIGSLKGTTARNAELIIASGSISDLSGPFVFIGSPNSSDEGVAGAFNTISKLYNGNAAPTISAATYGSGLDGTPFYASSDKSLYILNNSNVGNYKVDLTGNIEGNTISGTTIINLTSSFVSASNTVSAPTGSFGQVSLGTVSFSGLTEGRVTLVGPSGSLVDSGSLNFNNGQLGISGSIILNETANIYHDGTLYIDDTTNGLQLTGGNSAYFSINGSGYSNLVATNGLDIQSPNGPIWMWSDYGDVWLSSYDDNTLHLNADGGEGDVNVLNGGGNKLKIYGDTVLTGSLFATKIEGTGSLYLQPNQDDSRYFEIYNTSPTDTHIKANGGLSYFGDDTNYLKIDDGAQTVTVNGVNGVFINTQAQINGNAAFTGSVTITGNETVDYIQGLTHEWNYLAFNGGAVGAPGVELSSATNISLWAEGGYINVTGSMNVTGSASVTGSLVVTDGAAFIDQGVVAQNSNLLLTSGSSLYINDGGSAYISGDLWVTGNTYTTGSIYTQGDIVLSGSINIGDNITTDVINFNGEVSSSIIPKVNDAFDLGSSDNYWRDLYVSGTAHVGILNANSITLSGITVFDNLVVSGSSFLGEGGGDNVIVSGSMYMDSLTQGRFVIVGAEGQVTDSNMFNYDGSQVGISGSIKLNDTAYLYNDGLLYLQDTTNGVQINGGNSNKLELNSNGYVNLYSNGSGTDIEANGGTLWLWSDYNDVWIGSYDGSSLNLNHDGGEGNVNIGNGSNSLNINSHTYINNNKTLYVSRMWDNSDTTNYLELYGSNTNDGYWWESGSGADTTLNNNWGGANTNILNTNSGNVNIDATNGSVNLHSNNGFNVTGSMIVSDGSGIFNSSLITSNSDFYLESGSNQHMMNGAHLYFDTCVDIYWDNGTGDLIFYNDCNAFQFRNNVSITGSLSVSNNLYTDNIYGATYNGNMLNLNGGAVGAPDVELDSIGSISLWAEGGNITMTGSVHMVNNLDVSGSVYAGGMYNYNSNINGGGIYIDSGNYSEISYNNEEVYLYVSSDGIQGVSNSGTNELTSNAGDTTINANNGYYVNINGTNINLNGGTAVTGAFTVSSGSVTTLGGNLFVSGNLEVLGSQTNVNLESHTVNIGDNIILVNAYSPFQRYAGIAGFDSGSSGASGSLLWDSLNNYWNFVTNAGSSSKMIGTTAAALGSEISLTSGTFPIATGDDTIGDSLLTYSGTTLAYNTNKFTIDSSSGDTYISGNVTIVGAGGTDNGEGSSYVTFRNSDNILGFVDSTDTLAVTTQLLGYDEADGTLKFSSVIDGGSY